MAQHCRSGLDPFLHYTLCRHVAAGDWYKIEFDPEFHHHTSHCIVPRPSNHSTYHQLWKNSIPLFTWTIMHLVYPPKRLQNHSFQFPSVLQSSKENSKTKVMQNLGEQTRCIIGDVKMLNGDSKSRDFLQTKTFTFWTRNRSNELAWWNVWTSFTGVNAVCPAFESLLFLRAQF